MGKKDPRVPSDRERLFVAHYAATRDPCAAYKAAGYKCRSDAEALAKGRNLMDPHLNPRVAAAVAEALGARQGTPVLDARAVLAYVHAVMTFKPLLHGFDPGGDGGWSISLDAMRRLPAEVLQLIEGVEYRTVDLGEGRLATNCWVEFVRKTEAMKLAAKYQLPSLVFGPDGLPLGEGKQGDQGNKGVDWDRLMGARQVGGGRAQPAADDPVERKIRALEARTQDRPPPPNGKPGGAE